MKFDLLRFVQDSGAMTISQEQLGSVQESAQIMYDCMLKETRVQVGMYVEPSLGTTIIRERNKQSVTAECGARCSQNAVPGAQCTESSSARGGKRCSGLHFVGSACTGGGHGAGGKGGRVRALAIGAQGQGRWKGGSFMNTQTRQRRFAQPMPHARSAQSRSSKQGAERRSTVCLFASLPSCVSRIAHSLFCQQHTHIYNASLGANFTQTPKEQCTHSRRMTYTVMQYYLYYC